jgi:hypothetical protein
MRLGDTTQLVHPESVVPVEIVMDVTDGIVILLAKSQKETPTILLPKKRELPQHQRYNSHKQTLCNPFAL